LGAQCTHSRPFTRIDESKLDTGAIRVPTHFTTEGVNLLNQVPLGNPSNRRIARHLCNAAQFHGQEQRLRSHSRSGQGGLATGMAATYYDNVKCYRQELSLLSNAEFRENAIHYIICRNGTHDLPERITGPSKINCNKLGLYSSAYRRQRLIEATHRPL
jgi:hypothetical protein